MRREKKRIKIKIKESNLVEMDVDAVVCSANNWLLLGTGNAGEILKYGGRKIQEECDKIIAENHGKLLQIGSAVLTSGGKLIDSRGYRRYVIHAIGLGYKKRLGNRVYERIPATPKTVFNAVFNALKLADEKKIRSLAFPLMCARPRYSNLSQEKAPYTLLKSMINAMQRFQKKANNISRIVICVKDKDLVRHGKNLLIVTIIIYLSNFVASSQTLI